MRRRLLPPVPRGFKPASCKSGRGAPSNSLGAPVSQQPGSATPRYQAPDASAGRFAVPERQAPLPAHVWHLWMLGEPLPLCSACHAFPISRALSCECTRTYNSWRVQGEAALGQMSRHKVAAKGGVLAGPPANGSAEGARERGAGAKASKSLWKRGRGAGARRCRAGGCWRAASRGSQPGGGECPAWLSPPGQAA